MIHLFWSSLSSFPLPFQVSDTLHFWARSIPAARSYFFFILLEDVWCSWFHSWGCVMFLVSLDLFFGRPDHNSITWILLSWSNIFDRNVIVSIARSRIFSRDEVLSNTKYRYRYPHVTSQQMITWLLVRYRPTTELSRDFCRGPARRQASTKNDVKSARSKRYIYDCNSGILLF